MINQNLSRMLAILRADMAHFIALVQSDETERLNAIRKLVLFGPQAVDAVPRPIELMNEEEQQVRNAAITTLG